MANYYTVENLLIGKTYRSDSLVGEIVEAEKRNDSVWFDEAQAYLVRVQGRSGNHYFRTIAVVNN